MRWEAKKNTWRRWFAWYPVNLENSCSYVWLEYVERRQWHYAGMGGFQSGREYRSCG